ncbi:hypothetical protein [Nocardia tengchongensis]
MTAVNNRARPAHRPTHDIELFACTLALRTRPDMDKILRDDQP